MPPSKKFVTPDILGRARTFDGREVTAYVNGQFSWAGDQFIRGITGYMNDEQKNYYLRAVSLVLQELPNFDAVEVVTLIRMGRLATRTFTEDDRARFMMVKRTNDYMRQKALISKAFLQRNKTNGKVHTET
jgi:hypothetical protein